MYKDKNMKRIGIYPCGGFNIVQETNQEKMKNGKRIAGYMMEAVETNRI